MPCTDISEVLRLKLDSDDRVVGYSLTKLTCGGSVVGRSLIRRWIKHRTSDEILALSPDKLLRDARADDQVDEYLYLKHLLAVQSALATLHGRRAGGTADECVINTIAVDSKGKTEMLAELRVDMLTDRIKACGRCGCG